MPTRSVVINADPDGDFRQNVLRYALDCYAPPGERLFWDLVAAPGAEKDADIWGGFPESFAGDTEALVEECRELGGWLLDGADTWLTVLLVLPEGDFQALARPGPPGAAPVLSTAGAAAIAAIGALLAVVGENLSGVADVGERRNRLWTAIVVNRLGYSIEHAALAETVLERIGTPGCRVNTVFYLSLGNQLDPSSDAPGRRFRKLRLLIEITRPALGADFAGGPWQTLRRKTGQDARLQAFWVVVPREDAVVAPASELILAELRTWGQQIAAIRPEAGTSGKVNEEVAKIVTEYGLGEAPKAAGGKDVAPDKELQAELDATVRSLRTQLFRSRRRERTIRDARTDLPPKLAAFHGSRKSATVTRLREASNTLGRKQGEVASRVALLAISAGTLGAQEVKESLGTVTAHIGTQERSLAAEQAALAGHALVLEDVEPRRGRAFARIAEAEARLLRPHDLVWMPFLLMSPFIIFVLTFNFMNYISSTNQIDTLNLTKNVLNYVGWIVAPLTIMIVVIGVIVAFFLRGAHERARKALGLVLEGEVEALAREGDARLRIRETRDRVALLRILVARLDVRAGPHAAKDIDDRLKTLAAGGTGHGPTDDPEVVAATNDLRQIADERFKVPGTPAECLQAFLSAAKPDLKGEVRLRVPFLSGAEMKFACRFVQKAELELKAPGGG